MSDWTGTEVFEERHRLEQEAALLLGKMILEYSRLEMELGLFLAWSDGGESVERKTKAVEKMTFRQRLDELKKAAAKKLKASPTELEAYARWIDDAESIRKLRNNLFHGRWGTEARNQTVVNVVGLPTSPNQKRTAYTIESLKGLLDRMQRLQSRLQSLRSAWPA